MLKKIIGVDIGFANTGVVVATIPDLVIERAFVIKTEKDITKQSMRVADQRIQRMQFLIQELHTLIMQETLVQGHQVLIAVEAPHGGAQSGSAMRDMAAALAIIVTILQLTKIPVDYLSPSEVKLITTGKKTGKKPEVIESIVDHFGIHVDEKEIKITKGKRKGKTSVERLYTINENIPSLSGGDFEHVADAMAVIWWCSVNSNLYKLFLQ